MHIESCALLGVTAFDSILTDPYFSSHLNFFFTPQTDKDTKQLLSASPSLRTMVSISSLLIYDTNSLTLHPEIALTLYDIEIEAKRGDIDLCSAAPLCPLPLEEDIDTPEQSSRDHTL